MSYISYGQDEGAIWTKDGMERLLEEENIVYNGVGVHAFEIIERSGISNPLIKLLSEDDGSLSETEECFDSGWIDDLIQTLQMTKEEISKRNLWTYGKNIKENYNNK